MNRSTEEALAELEREAQVRKRCFDRWVQEGKVSTVDARDRMERLLSAIRHLRTFEDIVIGLASSQDIIVVSEGEEGQVLKMLCERVGLKEKGYSAEAGHDVPAPVTAGRVGGDGEDGPF